VGARPIEGRTCLRLTLPLIIAFATVASAAGETLDPRVAKGFDHFYNLEYDQAIAEFRKLVASDAGNPNFHNHVAQAVLYREMLRGGALESELVSGTNPFLGREKLTTTPDAEKEFHASIGKAMEISLARIQTNPNDTGALYALGVAHGLRANYNFLVRKAWMDSLRDATAARKAHNRVVELDPKFIDARLVQGLHDYIVGSLPFHIKILGFVAGFRGDREAGMKTLQMVAAQGVMNRNDAQVLLAVIFRREKKSEQALPLLNGLIARYPRNFLFRLETVQMYSDLGQKEPALAALDKIEQLKRSGAAGFATLPIEKLYYYRGNLLFWYKDFDAALEQIKKATAPGVGLDRHTSMMAWMRLGQLNDIKGRRNEAIAAYTQAVAVAPQSDVAKESRRYLSSPFKQT
jgi:tetratricopeptide (TPR) repeat protein